MKEKIDLESKEFICTICTFSTLSLSILNILNILKPIQYSSVDGKFLPTLWIVLFRQYPTLLENAESFFLYLAPFSEIPLFKFIDNLEKEFYVFYAIYLYKWLDKLSTLELNTPA